MAIKKYIPSRFNAKSRTDDGDLILYNSYTGAIATFTKEEEEEIKLVLTKTGVEIAEELPELFKELHESGFIVQDNVDEKMRAQFLHQSQHRTDVFHLIAYPTEECNFRCTYCYETFPRGKMTEDTREGLKKFVEDKGQALKHLAVSWFGGEPLTAPDVIGELSESFMNTANKFGFDYSAEIATNGYLLSKELFKQLLDWHIRRYMVTIDGVGMVHDKRRLLRGGGETFSKIVENLLNIKKLDEDFEIHIRVNFDNDNLAKLDELINFLKENFAGDHRFQAYYRPVGRWGGPNDEQLPVCDSISAGAKLWEVTGKSIKHGVKMSSYVESALMPTGSVCYAAKPHSLVVASDGKLHKCTLAFGEDMNDIGQLHRDGRTDLNYDRFATWVTSGEEKDEVCQSCFYRPACQGNHCPYYRFQTGDRPCSYEKKEIKKVLNLIWKDYTS